MKKKLLLFILLCVLFPAQNLIAADASDSTKYAAEKPTQWRTTSPYVSYTVDTVASNKQAIEVTYTIGAGATGDIAISFDEILASLTAAGYISYPSSTVSVKMNMVNNSSEEITYKKNSLLLTSKDNAVYQNSPSSSYDEYMFDAVGFDQQKIPLSLTNYRIANKAITKLCGRSSTSNVTIDDMINLYETLDQKGYTGSDALTQYYLDYYNAAYSTSATTLDGLDVKAISDICSTGNPGVSQTVATPQEKNDLQDRLEEYDETYPVHSFVESTTNTYIAKLFEVEKEIIQASYNFFYNETFGFSFDTINSPANDASTSTHSIGNYMRKEACYEEANSVFETIVLEPNGGSATIDNIAFHINGPLTGNSFQAYLFGYSASIVLNTPALETGKVTLSKVDSETLELIIDSEAEFNLYRLTTNQEKEYCGVGDTWVTDPKDAKVFTTNSGVLTIDDLPYGNYGFVEITAPKGYDLANEALTFTLDEDHPLLVLAFKNYKTPEEVPIEPGVPTKPEVPVSPSVPKVETPRVKTVDSTTLALWFLVTGISVIAIGIIMMDNKKQN